MTISTPSGLGREVLRDLTPAMAWPVIVPFFALLIPRFFPGWWPAPSVSILLSVVKITSILSLAGHASTVQKIVPEVPRLTRKLYAFTPAYMVLMSLVLVFQQLLISRQLPCYQCSNWYHSCIAAANFWCFYGISILSFAYMGIFTVANYAAMNKNSKWDNVPSDCDRDKAKKFAEFFMYMVNVPTLAAFAAILVIGLFDYAFTLDGDKDVRLFLEAGIGLLTFVSTYVSICVDIYARNRLDTAVAAAAPVGPDIAGAAAPAPATTEQETPGAVSPPNGKQI